MIDKENFESYFNLIIDLEAIFQELEDFFNEPCEENFMIFEDAFSVFKDVNREIEIDSGCTKGVIIHDELDYVIKIPFLLDQEVNHCEHEINVYEAAREQGIDYFFSPCKKIGEYRGVPIYIMKKANVDGGEFKKIGINMYKKTHKVSKQISDKELYRKFFFGYNNRRLIKYLFRYYYSDYSSIVNLINFLDEQYINDIHAYNVGVIENKVVLIDYSGI